MRRSSRLVRSLVSLTICLGSAVALCGLTVRHAQAQILFSFSPQAYTMLPTDTLTMTGYITNNTANTVFINSFTFGTNAGQGLTYSFFSGVPLSLAAGASYGSLSSPSGIITVNSNNAPTQSVNGIINLNGGLTPDEETLLAAANYSLNISSQVLPETDSLTSFGLGILTLGTVFAIRHRSARNKQTSVS